MSREYANQKVREGKAIMVRQISLPTAVINETLKVFENFEYMPFEDFCASIRSLIQSLDETGTGNGQLYSYAFSRLGVESLLLSMLSVQSDATLLTEDIEFSKLTEEEIDRYARNHRDAAKISHEIDRENPKLEDLESALEKTNDKDRVKSILLGAKEVNPFVHLPNNEKLPSIVSMPKTMLSKEHHAVSLTVSKFEEETTTAFVKLQAAGGMYKPALVGLDGIQIRMKIDSTNESLRALFIGKQLIRQTVRCNVSVTRAVRTADEKSTFFSLVNLLDADQQGQEVAEAMKQIKLKFGTVGSEC